MNPLEIVQRTPKTNCGECGYPACLAFAANVAAAGVIEGASQLGIPVSTTHCSSAAIMGVGATKRLSAVRWGVARRIVAAWVITFPVCGGLGYLAALLLRPLF